jgi:hypothetical protein
MAAAQPANKAPVSGSATDRRARRPNMPVQASRSTPPPNPAEPTPSVAAVCWLDRTRCASRYECRRHPRIKGAVAPFRATKTSTNAPLVAANRTNLVMRPFSSCLSLLSQWRQSAMDRAINLEFLWTLPPSSELHPKWSSRIRPPDGKG